MIASTSHDMRTPLNTIISMLNLIKNRITEPEPLKWIKVANNSTNLLLYLVNDTLDFFQIKSGKFSIKRTSFDIREQIEKCTDLIADSMKQKGIIKYEEIDPIFDQLVMKGDCQRINQILVNLLSNALKFTFQGHIKVKVQV